MPSEPRNGVQFDAMYNDVSGSASLTMRESNVLARHLTACGQNFRKISRSTFATLNTDEIAMFATTYTNSFIRANQSPSARDLAAGFLPFIQDKFNTEVNKRKTPRGRDGQKKKFMPIIRAVRGIGSAQLLAVFTMYYHLQQAKDLLVKKLNSASFIRTFLKTKDGWKVTGQEGFVAIDRTGTQAVKLVDRLDFSYANFNSDIIKGWQTDLRR